MLLAFQPLFALETTYQVKPGDIYKGYITEKIWLNDYGVPQVAISDIGYFSNVELPKDAKLSDPNKLQVIIGMAQKRPFAIVHIPAFIAGTEAEQVKQVSSFTLNISEEPKMTNKPAAKTSDVTTSALATGTWYKIAITKTGFYKIDYDFLKSMGVTPSKIVPGNIRIFGNGGHMLSEDNAVARPADLVENAILLNDNGDNVFDNGESAVFYGVGPIAWARDTTGLGFVHTKNLYSDTAYYFITFDQGAGKRITQQPAATAGNINVNSFNYYDVRDTDEVNPPGLGKVWYGEKFAQQLGTNSQSFSFVLGSTPVSNLRCNVAFGSKSQSAASTISVSLNGAGIGNAVFSNYTAANSDDVMAILTGAWSGTCNSSTANVGLSYTPSDGSGLGYLDYLEINVRLNLSMTGDQINFRDLSSVGTGNVANYQLQGANGNTRVWDVTNPQVPMLMNGSLSGSTYTFTQDAQTLHEFAAMNSLNVFTPKYEDKVPNQNLHGTGQVDCIIVTYPDFLSQAQQIADYHVTHDKMRVILATTTEVYNEFSSGGQDISAIRDFARMFYKRAGTDVSQMPKYLILFGGASYDYKNRLANNSNFVPVFESAESYNDLNAFCTDDFYGFLDDNEYIENNGIINSLDIGIGRLPARNTDDASALVNKALTYQQPATLGPWRLSTTFVADKSCVGPSDSDYDPAGHHMDDAEGMATQVTATGQNLYNEEKIYLDAIPISSTPAGARCPDANAALNEQVYNGTFLINYNGHGNPDVWSTERILTKDDFNNWNNKNAFPFMVTATCDFGQFDHPEFVSAAEQLVLRDAGGVIVVLTTTQSVYANYNHELNQKFLSAQFARNPDNSWNAFGDATRIGKNATYDVSTNGEEIANFRKFSLLGDPALTPDFPQYFIRLDSVTDGATQLRADTIKALGGYEMHGSVVGYDGNLLTDFNGLVSVSFFDKPRTVNAITVCHEQYKVQDNIVYRGRGYVNNGHFAFSFITPKDINYYFGTGKVSCYADNGATDAAGMDTTITVGGFSDHPVTSSNPPVVKPYINDSLFHNGGITGSNTSLFVTFYDETGINVSGNDIGHDLVGILDGNVEVPYVLNDYYQTEPNTYQRGYLSFPVTGLADGKHSIRVKAWDVNDNTGEGTVDFIVVDGQVVDIQQLGNYPNPFTNTTNFVFEHNHPDELLNVQIEIYNMAGMLLKNIKESINPSGSRTNEISWDGAGNNGDRLPSGVYVYRLNISTEKGFKSSAYQKLVIVR